MSTFNNNLLFLSSIATSFNSNSISSNLYNKIKIWASNTLPSGYVWCNGSNNTPDLSGYFIYGMSDMSASNSVSNTRINGLNINSLPSHSHAHNISSSLTKPSNISVSASEIDFTGINYMSGVQGPSAENGVNNLSSFSGATENHTHNFNQAYNGLGSVTGTVNMNHNHTISSTGTQTLSDLYIDGTEIYEDAANVTPDDIEPKYILLGLIMKTNV